jgi:hypothetical protein
MKGIGEPDDRKGHVRFDEGEQRRYSGYYGMRPIEALVRKLRVNELVISLRY